MIKYHIFKFEKLDVPDHWVSFPAFGELLQSQQSFAKEFFDVDITLNPDRVYQISLDQSSSNTGIFIKDYENTEAYMIEVSRSKGEDAHDYIYNLELFLHRLCEGCTFSHIIYERPIKTESFRSAQVLFQLEGAIRALNKRYTEFRYSKIDCIENASWRSVVVPSEIEKVYTNRKEASRIAVQKLFEWTHLYGPSIYKDNDVYEAVGIMMGWFFKSFDHLGRPYVRGDRTTRTIGGFCLPSLDGKTVTSMLAEKDITADLLIENPEYPIYRNLCSAVKPDKTICVEFSSRYAMLCMCVECNIKWLDPDVMTIILVDASTMDSRLKEITGGTFHFVL